MSLEVNAQLVANVSALERARPAKGGEGQGDDQHADTLPDDADYGVDRQLLQQLTKLNDRLDGLVPTQSTSGMRVQDELLLNLLYRNGHL